MIRIKRTIVVIAAGLIACQHALTLAAPLQLSLEESIDLALKNNPAIHIAGEDKERSQWGVSEAKAGKSPSISLGSSYNTGAGNSLGDGDINTSLRMSWPLYSGGRTEGQIAQAELGATTAELGVEKARQQVKLDTTAAYYNVLQGANMLAVSQETVNNLKAHLNIVQAKYEAGSVAKSDILRAEVELANAEQNLIKARNQRDLAVADLLNTMNLDAGTEIELANKLEYQADIRTLEEDIAFAWQNRPELAQAQASIDSAAIGVRIAESGKRPSVSLSASTGWSDAVLPDDNDWSVGVSASWNIFDAGVTKAKIKQADSSLNTAKLQAEQTRDAVEQEVRQSYLSMREAEQRLQSTEVAVGKAKEDLYIAKEKYTAGTGTNIDVIDAQLALTQAETNHVQALYDYNLNNVRLDKAIGLPVGETPHSGGKQ